MRWVDAAPVFGRTLIPADGETGAERVVVIRESLWRRRYSGDADLDRPAARRSAASRAPSSASCPTRSSSQTPASCGCRSTSGPSAGAPQPAQWRYGPGPACAFSVCFVPASTFEAANTEINQLSQQFPSTNEPGRHRAAARSAIHGGFGRQPMSRFRRSCSCSSWCCWSWRATWPRSCSRAPGRARRSWRCEPRSAPHARASSASCSSRRCCSDRSLPSSA